MVLPQAAGVDRKQAVGASPVKSSAVEPKALLFVGDHDVKHVMSLRVLALEGRSASFSVFGDLRSDGHHHLAALLHRGFYRVGTNSLYRNHVGVGNAGHRVVLAVEFCVVLNVKLTSVGIGALGVDLDALVVSFDLYGGILRRRSRTVLGLIRIHLPGSGMLIGSRCRNRQSESHEQQCSCESNKPVGSHNLTSAWGCFGWAGWCRRYARKFAESPEDSCKSSRTLGERERESRPAWLLE